MMDFEKASCDGIKGCEVNTGKQEGRPQLCGS